MYIVSVAKDNTVQEDGGINNFCPLHIHLISAFV